MHIQPIPSGSPWTLELDGRPPRSLRSSFQHLPLPEQLQPHFEDTGKGREVAIIGLFMHGNNSIEDLTRQVRTTDLQLAGEVGTVRFARAIAQLQQ